jgi:hypothetical protein
MEQSLLKKVCVFIIFMLLLGISIVPTLSGMESSSLNQYCTNAEIKNNAKTIQNPTFHTSWKYDSVIEDSSTEQVTICLKRYDSQKKKLIDEPVGTISMKKALNLKGQLSDMWKMDSTIDEKIKGSLDLLDNSEIRNIPQVKNIIDAFKEKDIAHHNKGDIFSKDYVFNVLSFWGMFCFGQPTILGFFAPIFDDIELWGKVFPEGDGYNMSLLFEYGVVGLVFPFMGLGFFGTAGAFGIKTLQDIPFSSPTAFFGFLAFTLFFGISFKFGNPLVSLAELNFGFAGFPIVFPL